MRERTGLESELAVLGLYEAEPASDVACHPSGGLCSART
jgi:hypothetical protein